MCDRFGAPLPWHAACAFAARCIATTCGHQPTPAAGSYRGTDSEALEALEAQRSQKNLSLQPAARWGHQRRTAAAMPPKKEPRRSDATESERSNGDLIRMYEVYLKGRWQEVVEALLPLQASHWRQLLDFGAGFRSFVLASNPVPPPLPCTLLIFLVQVFFVRSKPACPTAVEGMPLAYVHFSLLMRHLLQRTQPGEGRSAGPPLAVKFLVRLAGARSVATLLQNCQGDGQAWVANFNAAWDACGEDVLADCMVLLGELYPGEREVDGVDEATKASERMTLASLLIGAALQCSLQNLQSSPREQKQKSANTCRPDARALYLRPEDGAWSCIPREDHKGLFAKALHCSCSVRPPGGSTVDRFLLSMLDILIDAEDAVVNPDHSDSLEIRTFARLLRVLLQAYFIDPALLAAAESDAEGARLAGAFAGPSDPSELVPVLHLAFMEQSPLLQVVQRRLCGAPFDDVLGSTEQLQRFALRELRVAWFDLRRSTCTLKRGTPPGTLLLLMKPLKLQLSCACEADLASFPYMSLAAAAQVTVRELKMSTAFVLGHAGLKLDGLGVSVPELEIKLSDATLLSRTPALLALHLERCELLNAAVLRLERSSRSVEVLSSNEAHTLTEDLCDLAKRWPEEEQEEDDASYEAEAPIFLRLEEVLVKLPSEAQEKIVAAFRPLRAEVSRRLAEWTNEINDWLSDAGSPNSSNTLQTTSELLELLREIEASPQLRWYRQCRKSRVKAKFLMAEHLQLQLKRILTKLLEREFARWNANTWSFLQSVVPEDMLLGAMQWLDEKIPREGLPV
eukprot:g30056.t1